MSMSPLLNLGRTKLARGQVDTLYARVKLLELHLRRVLEAGMKLRWSDATDPWDQAASDAEGVLK